MSKIRILFQIKKYLLKVDNSCLNLCIIIAIPASYLLCVRCECSRKRCVSFCAECVGSSAGTARWRYILPTPGGEHIEDSSCPAIKPRESLTESARCHRWGESESNKLCAEEKKRKMKIMGWQKEKRNLPRLSLP